MIALHSLERNISPMANLTIRKIEGRIKDRLRVRAARKGLSMEEEARRILAGAVDEGGRSVPNVADAIAALTDPIGGMPLDLPPRFSEREPPFGEVLWDDPE
jgi:antitoxin FitA